MHAITGTDDSQLEEEEAVYVLLDMDDLEAGGQLQPGQSIELSVRTVSSLESPATFADQCSHLVQNPVRLVTLAEG
jgi:hypothetical protein